MEENFYEVVVRVIRTASSASPSDAVALLDAVTLFRDEHAKGTFASLSKARAWYTAWGEVIAKNLPDRERIGVRKFMSLAPLIHALRRVVATGRYPQTLVPAPRTLVRLAGMPAFMQLTVRHQISAVATAFVCLPPAPSASRVAKLVANVLVSNLGKKRSVAERRDEVETPEPESKRTREDDGRFGMADMLACLCSAPEPLDVCWPPRGAGCDRILT
jgi:hypothetical protein